MSGGKSTPDAPDYTGAALAQAAASKELTEQQTWANRPTQNTPWGTISWDRSQQWDPVSNQWMNEWTQNLNLDPMSEWALENQKYLQGARSELGGDLMDRASQEFGEELDFSGIQDWGASPETAEDIRNKVEQTNYERQMQYMDPEFETAGAQLESKLWGQGLRPGDAAYDREMEKFDRTKQKAYADARLGAIEMGGAEGQRAYQQDLGRSEYQNTMRQAQLAEMMQKRGWSLNEINALISGQQVSQPSMPGFNAASRSETPNLVGAAGQGYQAELDRFNAGQAGWQGLLGGATQLGSAYLSGGLL